MCTSRKSPHKVNPYVFGLDLWPFGGLELQLLEVGNARAIKSLFKLNKLCAPPTLSGLNLCSIVYKCPLNDAISIPNSIFIIKLAPELLSGLVLLFFPVFLYIFFF